MTLQGVYGSFSIMVHANPPLKACPMVGSLFFQDQRVQQLMNDLDLPADRANLFEVRPTFFRATRPTAVTRPVL